MKTSNSKVIIFGGAFNPPTLAHQQIISKCLELEGFDEVWVMPSGDRTDKKISVVKEHRLAMLEALRQHEFNGSDRLKITDFELNLPTPTETYQTFQVLTSAFADKTFWFVFGSDSYRDMPNWDNGSELRSKLNFILIERDGDKVFSDRSQSISLGSSTELSSTLVRDSIARGKSVDSFLSKSVNNHIKTHGLYR